mmetsp:Transcript_3195/g.12330  ORF Transcript_3195/g.12330 Transcript_3195/m.12330 type:complete len:314 (+) Transcript_3195:596-1537(+)
MSFRLLYLTLGFSASMRRILWDSSDSSPGTLSDSSSSQRGISMRRGGRQVVVARISSSRRWCCFAAAFLSASTSLSLLSSALRLAPSVPPSLVGSGKAASFGCLASFSKILTCSKFSSFAQVTVFRLRFFPVFSSILSSSFAFSFVFTGGAVIFVDCELVLSKSFTLTLGFFVVTLGGATFFSIVIFVTVVFTTGAFEGAGEIFDFAPNKSSSPSSTALDAGTGAGLTTGAGFGAGAGAVWGAVICAFHAFLTDLDNKTTLVFISVLANSSSPSGTTYDFNLPRFGAIEVRVSASNVTGIIFNVLRMLTKRVD